MSALTDPGNLHSFWAACSPSSAASPPPCHREGGRWVGRLWALSGRTRTSSVPTPRVRPSSLPGRPQRLCLAHGLPGPPLGATGLGLGLLGRPTACARGTCCRPGREADPQDGPARTSASGRRTPLLLWPGSWPRGRRSQADHEEGQSTLHASRSDPRPAGARVGEAGTQGRLALPWVRRVLRPPLTPPTFQRPHAAGEQLLS